MRGSCPMRRPVRARCRSIRRPRTCSTAPTTRRACLICRRSATSTRASRTRPPPYSRNAWRRSRADAPALRPATGQAAQMTRCSRCSSRATKSFQRARSTVARTAVRRTFRKLGIDTTFVDPDDPQNFKKAITKKTKLLYAETIGNPRINVLDIEAVAKIAKDAGIPLMIDNTFAIAVPVPAVRVRRRHRRAFGHQVHRRPRHDDGRRDCRIGKFPWDNGNFPDDRALARLSRRALLRDVRRFWLHDESAHGNAAHARSGPVAVTMAAAAGSGDAARAHGPAFANALAVAKFLEAHPQVSWVNYPGLPEQPVLRARAEVSAQGRRAPS